RLEGPPDRDQVDICKMFIEQVCEPTKTIQRDRGSYGWKHDVESWADGAGEHVYISNGAFIQAAHELGIRIKPDGSGINADLALRLQKPWRKAARRGRLPSQAEMIELMAAKFAGAPAGLFPR